MTDLENRLERFETLTAECELIAKLATDSAKREFYLKLAEQYRELACDMKQAIAMPAYKDWQNYDIWLAPSIENVNAYLERIGAK